MHATKYCSYDSKSKKQNKTKDDGKKNNKAVYTATKVACGWAGAVMKKANSSIWAGAPKNAKNAEKADGDRPTDIAGYRVACTRLKI